MPLDVQVVSPERVLWTGSADMVRCRTLQEGEIAFLTGHTPFVGALDTCVVLIRPTDGEDELVAVHGGFVEVSGNAVSVLSDVAELASQIDLDRAREAEQRAEQKARESDDGEVEAALRRAHVRIEAAGGLR